MQIKIVSGADVRTVECGEGESFLSILRANGYDLPAGCGGRGTCGKCRVRVMGGPYGAKGQEVLACQTTAMNGCTVVVERYEGGGLIEGTAAPAETDGEAGFGIAIDIGTTTLAFSLVSLSDGKTISRFATLNRQQSFGADVISRIVSAEEGNAARLAQCVRAQVEEAIGRFRAQYDLRSVRKAAVCGNTTMLHLFCGEDVSGIGRYPFRPAFTEYRSLAGHELGLSVEEIQVLPCVSAFVGADIVAGCIATGVDRKDGILADIGTNGEMFAHAGDRWMCTSTAAGPCLEGATIECGLGGVPGAIDSVRWKGGKTEVTTIGGGKPRGICGAGLVDAIAALLDGGIIDGTGAFLKGDRFLLAEGIFLTQKDVRSFQLAKSAICAGIRVLTERAGLSAKLVPLWIAGGLGYYWNADNARKVGLLPSENAGGQHVVGNAALAGTQACMLSRAALQRACALAARTEYLDLSADEAFMNEYIQNMQFEGYE